jgi:hypothetical protein
MWCQYDVHKLTRVYTHVQIYVLHSTDPEFKQSNKMMWSKSRNTQYVIQKYYKYFTYSIQMLIKINYMLLTDKSFVTFEIH